MLGLSYEIRDRYPVSIGQDLGSLISGDLGDILHGRRMLLCVTPTVHRLYGQRVEQLLSQFGADIETTVVDIDEATKSLAMVMDLCARAKAVGLGRRDLMVALGGGVLSDVVRLAASLVRRGIGHVCIPTTLIGQVDAGIGIKAAVNFEGSKSYLGAFHAPKAVLVDTHFLHSLPAAAIRDGMAEILKVALALDGDLFETIEAFGADLVRTRFAGPAVIAEQVVRRAAALGMSELELDLFERGSLKRMLDFGHSFSPLIESAHDFTLSHGRAVAIDICLSSAIAVELRLLKAEDFHRIMAVFQAVGLDRDDPMMDVPLLDAALDSAARHRGGTPNLVVPDGIGSARFVGRAELTPEILQSALVRLRAACAVQPARRAPLSAAAAGRLCA